MRLAQSISNNLKTERIKKNTKIRKSTQDRLFKIFCYIFIITFSVICFLPFWIVIINSFTAEEAILRNGFQLFPTDFSLSAYTYLLNGKQIGNSYMVTTTVTIIGTLLAVLITSMFSYAISHKKLKYGNFISFMTYATMIFGTGLVGFYILIARWLALKDTIWAMILPYLLNPFYAFILVSFYRSIPYEINEAAIVDGANEIRIFFKIITPISLPALATVSLFYALQYWNDFWLALLFVDNNKLHPLQMMIRQMISNINIMQYIGNNQTNYNQMIPAYGVQLATVCLTIGPIILLYPFLQNYFVKGVTIGAVKG